MFTFPDIFLLNGNASRSLSQLISRFIEILVQFQQLVFFYNLSSDHIGRWIKLFRQYAFRSNCLCGSGGIFAQPQPSYKLINELWNITVLVFIYVVLHLVVCFSFTVMSIKAVFTSFAF